VTLTYDLSDTTNYTTCVSNLTLDFLWAGYRGYGLHLRQKLLLLCFAVNALFSYKLEGHTQTAAII